LEDEITFGEHRKIHGILLVYILSLELSVDLKTQQPPCLNEEYLLIAIFSYLFHGCDPTVVEND
jgi:hypothetical protein